MLNQDNLETIKRTVKEFLENMTFEAEVEVSLLAENPVLISPRAPQKMGSVKEGQTLLVDVKTEEPQVLIGERGETLMEIQHLLKLILRKKLNSQEPFYVDLDINDYKKKKIDYLKDMAKSAADEALMTKKEKELPPMSSYERRIVHMELAQRSDVVSESVGEEPERRIIIKPRVENLD